MIYYMPHILYSLLHTLYSLFIFYNIYSIRYFKKLHLLEAAGENTVNKELIFSVKYISVNLLFVDFFLHFSFRSPSIKVIIKENATQILLHET